MSKQNGEFTGLDRKENEQEFVFDEEYKVAAYEIETGVVYDRIYTKGTKCRFLGTRVVETPIGNKKVNTYEIIDGKIEF